MRNPKQATLCSRRASAMSDLPADVQSSRCLFEISRTASQAQLINRFYLSRPVVDIRASICAGLLARHRSSGDSVLCFKMSLRVSCVCHS